MSTIFNDKIKALQGQGKALSGGVESLSSATALTVTTGLAVVEVAVASVDTAASSAGTLTCNIPDQTVSTNLGKIILTSSGATGTTKVNWVAFGY